MSFNKDIFKKLDKQYKFEETAMNAYSGYLKRFSDKKILSTVKIIRDDELRHMESVKKIISILDTALDKKPNVVLKPKKLSKHVSKFQKKFSKSNSILLSCTLEDHYVKIIDMIKWLTQQNNVVYLSYNKLTKYTKAVFEEHDVDMDKVLFINATNEENTDDLNVNPGNLSRMGILISSLSKKLENMVLIVDPISSFMIFHTPSTICKFVSSVNNSAESKNFKVMWISVDTEKSLIAKIGSISDETLKL